jgi:hypothetical protein
MKVSWDPLWIGRLTTSPSAGIKRIRLGDKGKGRETEEPIIPWAKRTEVKKTDPDTRLFHDHKGIKWLMKQCKS